MVEEYYRNFSEDTGKICAIVAMESNITVKGNLHLLGLSMIIAQKMEIEG